MRNRLFHLCLVVLFLVDEGSDDTKRHELKAIKMFSVCRVFFFFSGCLSFFEIGIFGWLDLDLDYCN